MDVVLEEIHYNPDCFSKIVEDFEDYVEHTELGLFQKAFDDIKDYTPDDLFLAKEQTKNMELAISELKKQVLLLFGRFCRR